MKTDMIVYNIAESYSTAPVGRYKHMGEATGEGFREVLVELLKKAQKVKLLMDDTWGFGSSFLEEAFGGLIREENMTKDEIFERIEFCSEDPTILPEIKGYIESASLQKEASLGS